MDRALNVRKREHIKIDQQSGVSGGTWKQQVTILFLIVTLSSAHTNMQTKQTSVGTTIAFIAITTPYMFEL
jgi:hypothetical protein